MKSVLIFPGKKVTFIIKGDQFNAAIHDKPVNVVSLRVAASAVSSKYLFENPYLVKEDLARDLAKIDRSL